MSAIENPMIGKIINNKYKVVKQLNQGGMGLLFKVEHTIIPGKFFALKMIYPYLSSDIAVRKRFMREIDLTMEFSHENIVQIRDFGQMDSGELYFTMDFCDGESLEEHLKTNGSITLSRTLIIVIQVLQALGKSHSKGIVHRDIKPSNIMLEPMSSGLNRVKLLDFGIAKAFENVTSHHNITQENNVLGTPYYMSPEQIRGAKIDGRTDLYSLGVVMYEMLTGQVPFSGKTAGLVIMKHLNEKPPAFKKMSADLKVPPKVEEIVMKALSKDKNDRFKSALEMIKALEKITFVEIKASRPATRSFSLKEENPSLSKKLINTMHELEKKSFWYILEHSFEKSSEKELQELLHVWEKSVREAFTKEKNYNLEDVMENFRIMPTWMLEKLIDLGSKVKNPEHIYKIISKVILQDVQPLIQGLTNADIRMGLHCQKIFTRMMVTKLLKLCNHSKDKVRLYRLIIQTVQAKGEISLLIEKLIHEDKEIAYHCYKILCLLKDPVFFSSIQKIVDHPSKNLRIWAIDILRKYNIPEASGNLCAFLKDEDINVVSYLLSDPIHLAHKDNFFTLFSFMQTRGSDLETTQLKKLYQALILSNLKQFHGFMDEVFIKGVFLVDNSLKKTMEKVKNGLIEACIELEDQELSQTICSQILQEKNYTLSKTQKKTLETYIHQDAQIAETSQDEPSKISLKKYFLSGIPKKEMEIVLGDTQEIYQTLFESEDSKPPSYEQAQREAEERAQRAHRKVVECAQKEAEERAQEERARRESEEKRREQKRKETRARVRKTEDQIRKTTKKLEKLSKIPTADLDEDIAEIRKNIQDTKEMEKTEERAKKTNSNSFFKQYLETTYLEDPGRFLNILKDFFVQPFSEGDEVSTQRDEILLFLCKLAGDKNILIFLDYLHTQEQFRLNSFQKSTVRFLLKKEGLV